MNITLKKIPISELYEGYVDNGEGGVIGYKGLLNIRPAYQREFIYRDAKRNAVINTVRKGFPLNTMYWAVTDDGYEVMDGQQRTISICQYIDGDFSIDYDGTPRGFANLTRDLKQKIMDYELHIYICDGKDSEKLDWFKIINIAGEKLSDQELRNAIYTGPWLTDAKRWFSKKTGTPALQDGRDKLVNGASERQEILEKAIDWISGGDITNYMKVHQHDADAQEIWMYWQEIFDWVKRVFPNQDSARTRLMKGLPWGEFFNRYKSTNLNASYLETQIIKLIADDEVDNKRGIYEYLLSGSEKVLNLRTFDEKTKQTVYAKQGGICPHCPSDKGSYALTEMEADHKTPWSKGGKTTIENCEMLCKKHNRSKGGR